MSDIKDRAKQLQFDVAKLLSNNLKIPVIVIDGNMIDKILEDIKKDENITKLYSDEELRDEVSEFYTKSETPRTLRPKPLFDSPSLMLWA